MNYIKSKTVENDTSTKKEKKNIEPLEETKEFKKEDVVNNEVDNSKTKEVTIHNKKKNNKKK